MAILSGVCRSTGPGSRASFENKYNKGRHNIPRITVKKLRLSKEHRRHENEETWQPARQISASKSFKDM
jgi:hypothetical protein